MSEIVLFDGETGRELDRFVSDSRLSLRLLLGGVPAPDVDLRVVSPEIWWLASSLAKDERDTARFAQRLLVAVPGLAERLGDDPPPMVRRVVGLTYSSPPGPPGEAHLRQVESGLSLELPAYSLRELRALERLGEVPVEKLIRNFWSSPPPPAYRAGPLPRLETERSLSGSADPELENPGVSLAWDLKFKTFFLGLGGYGNSDGTPFVRCTRRFLGPTMSPGGLYTCLFLLEDESTSLDELRQSGFRKTVSTTHPQVTSTDEWLVDRMLNGFNPVRLRQTDPTGTTLYVEYVWDDCDFTDVDPGKSWGLSAHEGSKSRYELPNVRAELTRQNDKLTLDKIEVTYRNGPRMRRASAARPMVHDPTETYTPASPHWDYAKRLLRNQLVLDGELGSHLAFGHLMIEQYLAALETTLGTTNKTHPLYTLLQPYLREVDRINAYGDTLVIGETGALSNGSALSLTSIDERLVALLGAMDWKGFSPRAPVVSSHRYANAAAIFWTTIRSFVTLEVGKLTSTDWIGVDQFSQQLTAHSPPYVPYFGVERGDPAWLDAAELPLPRAAGAPSMSRVSTDPAQRAGDLVQLVTHALFHAIFVHTWANDRQFEDVGDPAYACFGLMSRDKPPTTGDPAQLESWSERADPLLRDAGFQMTVARILTHMDVGHVMAATGPFDLLGHLACRRGIELPAPVHANLRAALCQQKGPLAQLHAGDPFLPLRHERDRIDLLNFRSLINT